MPTPLKLQSRQRLIRQWAFGSIRGHGTGLWPQLAYRCAALCRVHDSTSSAPRPAFHFGLLRDAGRVGAPFHAAIALLDMPKEVAPKRAPSSAVAQPRSVVSDRRMSAIRRLRMELRKCEIGARRDGEARACVLNCTTISLSESQVETPPDHGGAARDLQPAIQASIEHCLQHRHDSVRGVTESPATNWSPASEGLRCGRDRTRV
jgi:hypothetical protein